MDKNDEFEIILQSCRKGRTLMTAACLVYAGDKRDELLLQRHTTADGETYSPFLLAVRQGYTQLVRLLLVEFNVDSSKHKGTLNFDGYFIENASPLWCAAACGYFDIVKLLISNGANVNDTTSTRSTPLRAACFHGNLSIVDYLLKHGADANLPNQYNNTCLMVSAFRGNLEVVEYLLHYGVDVNAQAQCGGTALHFACDSRQLGIVEALVNAGCDITIKNKSCLTAPMVAADACHSDVIEFFTRRKDSDPETNIMLLELLGASYANDKDNYSTEKTFHFLCLAMLMRIKDKIVKQVEPAVEAYGNKVECQVYDELQSIRHDQDAIHIEALIVRERILGKTSPELIHPIVYRGAVYADGHQFDKCIKLWRHAIYLHQLNKRPVSNDLLRFAEVFSEIYVLTHELNTTDLLETIECCIEEIKNTKAEVDRYTNTRNTSLSCKQRNDNDDCDETKVRKSCPKCGHHQPTNTVESRLSTSWRHLETNQRTLLYLLLLVCKVVKEDDRHVFGKLLYRYLKLDIRDSNEATLLHLAVDEQTHVDDFHVKDICSFPNYELTKFLLSCGADPDARMKGGNTPLHIIVQYERPISDFISLHTIISQLLEYGAHFDVANDNRKTPMELSTTGVAEIILKTQSKLTLKCLAAQVIRRAGVRYRGRVPYFLEEYIAMH
uniref:protein fem-1 homolog B-like n=1 Tax=Ciona intestinalis TaxID=7719 RepID=UPI000180BF17|nr:protein fem-1 homolog B-like [Ciona intestinalis]|eukprot:XP_002128243.1 protein fem-1 homolog B-like [Ciona intestinalis]